MKHLTTKLLIWLVRLYQSSLGQLIGGRCRFYPSCSNYALEALSTHGTMRGTWLAARRVCKCHPFGGHGVDLVPPPAKPSSPTVNQLPGRKDRA
jgi:uncharacterized protein